MLCVLCATELPLMTSVYKDSDSDRFEGLIVNFCKFLSLPTDEWSFNLRAKSDRDDGLFLMYCESCIKILKEIESMWRNYEEIQANLLKLRSKVEEHLIQAVQLDRNEDNVCQLRMQLANALNLSPGEFGSQVVQLNADPSPTFNSKHFDPLSTATLTTFSVGDDNNLASFSRYEVPVFVEDVKEEPVEFTENVSVDPTSMQHTLDLESNLTPEKDCCGSDDPLWMPPSPSPPNKSDSEIGSNSSECEFNDIEDIDIDEIILAKNRNNRFVHLTSDLKSELIAEIASSSRELRVNMKHIRWDVDENRWIIPRFRHNPLRRQPLTAKKKKLKKIKDEATHKLSKTGTQRRKRKIKLVSECDEVFPCPVCGWKFDTVKRKNAHILRKHEGDKYAFKCSICNRGYTKDYELLNHEKKCHALHLNSRNDGDGNKKGHCENGKNADDTSASGADQISVRDLITTVDIPIKVLNANHVKIGKLPKKTRNRKQKLISECTVLFPCQLCPFRFDTARRLNAHVLRRHEGDPKPFKCRFCGTGFHVDRACISHERGHTNERPFVCDKCGKAFPTDYQLQRHSRKHGDKRPTKSEQFPCSICGKILVTRNGWRVHLKIHNEVRDICCELCGATFFRQVDLKTHHMSKHPDVYDVSGDPEYRCKICSKLFYNKYYVTRHERLHVGTDIPYHCSVCPYKCFGKFRFDIHMTSHENKRLFKCTYPGCTIDFNTVFLLRKHTQTVHSDERPFSCKLCDKAFKVKQHLKNHMALHRNLNNIKCPLCNEGFPLRKYMLRHVEKHKNGVLPIPDKNETETKDQFKN